MFDVNDLDRLRHVVKTAAHDELLRRFAAVDADVKVDGSLITAADLAMQRRLQRELAGHWPDYALLGEEMSPAQQQSLLAAPGRGLWCLDPLDGTSNFAAGVPYFAVSLALIADDRTVAAIVYDPARSECFSALRGHGAWLNERPITAPDATRSLADAMAMVDLKRLPVTLIRAFAERSPYRSQRSFGSVALDWCWIACGRCQVYLHGGQKLWDYAAGLLVMQEAGGAGGVLDTYDGDWLRGYSLAPRIAIAATHPDLLVQWRNWISAQLDG